MKRTQLIILWTLLVLPWLAILGLGSYALWRIGWAMWVWVPVAICYGLALLLTKVWGTRWSMFSPPAAKAAEHWTPRDQTAWKLVEARAATLDQLPTESLLRPQIYFDTALELSREVSHLYHPDSETPWDSLTIPEILAALELAFEDLAEMVERYLPAGHVLTINHWQKLTKLPKWYKNFAKFYWPVSAAFAPATVVARYATSKVVMSPLKQNLQDNVLSWFYMAYVQRIGRYVIELNSGRLAGGAARYRAAFGKKDPQAATAGPTSTNHPEDVSTATGSDKPKSSGVTLAVIGQAAAGKSSLVRCLLRISGEDPEPVKTDIESDTPAESSENLDQHAATLEQQHYELRAGDDGEQLVLLDTIGYQSAGFTEKQQRQLEKTLQNSDLILLVMNATQPSREPDQQVLAQLTDWYREHPHTKPVPVLGVLTHIDGLRPAREWQPPYDWQTSNVPKAVNIREAVAYCVEIFGEQLAGVVPVCTQPDSSQQFGIEEYLLPAMTGLLDKARTTSLLRALHKDIDRNAAGRIGQQLWEVGKLLVKAGLGSRK